jgi:transposase InsO family protein
VTKEVIKELKMILLYGRLNRPTDNAIYERFFRTVNQEEVYRVLDYPHVVSLEKSSREA